MSAEHILEPILGHYLGISRPDGSQWSVLEEVLLKQGSIFGGSGMCFLLLWERFN